MEGNPVLQKAIESDQPSGLAPIYDQPTESLQKVGIECIRKRSYKCLAQILRTGRLSCVGLANLAKDLNDGEAFRICVSSMGMNDMLALMSFTSGQYGLAIQLVEKLGQHHRFVQGFKVNQKGSDFVRAISDSPVILKSNIVNPYEGEYLPGRESLIEDVCTKTCYPSGLQRNIICFCGRDHSGKTTIVKKIATLSSYCQNTVFNGILVVEAYNNIHCSNVEDLLKTTLGSLTGDPSLDQLFNEKWMLVFIVKSSDDSNLDKKNSEMVAKCLEKLVAKSDKKLRIVLRLPFVKDAEFLKKSGRMEIIHEIPDLSTENFNYAAASLFGRTQDSEIDGVLETLPKTLYFLHQLKIGGQNAANEIRQSKGKFVEKIGKWKGEVQSFQKEPSFPRSHTSQSNYGYGDTPSSPMADQPPTYYRSNTMPDLGGTSYADYTREHAYSPGYNLGYHNRGGHFSNYSLRITVSLPELKNSPHYTDDFHKSVDVTFVLLIEQYFHMKEHEVEFMDSSDPSIFRYSVNTQYRKAMDMLKRSTEDIQRALLTEVQNRARNSMTPLYGQLQNTMKGLRIEITDATQTGHYDAHNNYYNRGYDRMYSQHSQRRDFDYESFSPYQLSPAPRSPGAMSPDSVMNARNKKKKNQKRSHSNNYRARQDLVQSKRQAVKDLLGDRLIPDEKMIYLRGPKVLFIPSKSPNSLMKIADFIKDIDDDPNVRIMRAALPLSRKNEFQLKGFLAYLEMENEQQVKYVQDNIYQKKYKAFFQKCVAAEFKKSFKTEKGQENAPQTPMCQTPSFAKDIVQEQV